MEKVDKNQEEIRRFTAKKKTKIVMDIFQGKATVAEVSRKYDLTPAVSTAIQICTNMHSKNAPQQ